MDGQIGYEREHEKLAKRLLQQVNPAASEDNNISEVKRLGEIVADRLHPGQVQQILPGACAYGEQDFRLC